MTGALESHFSGVEKNLQFVHLRERLEREVVLKILRQFVTPPQKSPCFEIFSIFSNAKTQSSFKYSRILPSIASYNSSRIRTQ